MMPILDPIVAAMRLAVEAVRVDIRSEAAPVVIDGEEWLDVRPMLDTREHSPAQVDQFALAFAFGQWAGCLRVHWRDAWLVQLIEPASAVPEGRERAAAGG